MERLEAQLPPIQLAHALVAEFFGLVRERKADALETWLKQAEAIELSDLVSFCGGVSRNWGAVKAALSLEWSNGPMEGQINRL